MKEHDYVVVIEGQPDAPKGWHGTVVHIYPEGKLCEVKFITTKGNVVVTMQTNQLESA